MLNALAVAGNWRLSTRSVVNLARWQVHHTEHSPYLMQRLRSDAACRAGLLVTADPRLSRGSMLK